jgi:hypothetical protein
MLKDVISANPKKDLTWCLELVITKLQKLYQALKYNYDSSEGTFAGQLISACQGVEACVTVLIQPAGTFEGIAFDLRNAVGNYVRCRPQRTQAYNNNNNNNNGDKGIENTTAGNDGAYYTNRRYSRNDGFRNRGKPRGSYRGSYRRSYNGRNGRGKKCYVCGKQGCWSTRYGADEKKGAY